MQLSLYARVIGDGTPLRGNPSNQAYLQNILNKEAVVYIFQSQYAEDGMTWYLVQYSGQWGFVRADLVRVMGEEETAEYLAALEAAQATPTPMPQATPEPLGPDATSAYAKLIKDAVNLRRTPSASGHVAGPHRRQHADAGSRARNTTARIPGIRSTTTARTAMSAATCARC